MKKLKKLMAALLVALMALAVIPAGAFAEDTAWKWTPVGTKEVTNNGPLPQTFSYTVTNTATQALGTLDQPNTVMASSGTVTVTEEKNPEVITFNEITFTEPGYYYFTIQENDHPTFSPATGSTSTYYALVAVDNTGAIHAVYATEPFEGTIPDQDGNDENKVTVSKDKVDTMTFLNTMNEDQVIKIYKTTTGTAANPDDLFPVSITVTGNTDGAVTFTGYNEDGTETITKTLENGNGTVTGLYVKNGNTASISSTAISTNTTISVTETNSKNYTVTYSGANGELNENGAYEFKKSSATDEVTITNTKNASTITGFVMHYTPYIALIVVAGVAVALIAKRRNHSEF